MASSTTSAAKVTDRRDAVIVSSPFAPDDVALSPLVGPVDRSHAALEFASWIAMLVLLGASVRLRMHHLTTNGTVGSDTFQYWAITFEWLKGHFILNPLATDTRHYFRPTFYALNAFAVLLFGKHDFAIRALMGIFETGNVFLVFLIGRRFFQNAFFGLCLAGVYAVLPSAILHSQTELPHTFSVTWVLLMFLFFLRALQRKPVYSPKAIFATGLFAGLAATTHGSCTFYGPVLVILWSLAQWAGTSSLPDWLARSLRSAFLVSLGFAIPYLIFGALVGYRYMIWAIASETSIRTGEALNPWYLFLTYLTQGPQESISLLAKICFLVSLFVVATRFCAAREKFLSISPGLIVLLFAVLFSFVFQNVFYSRLFLPLNVFVLLSILVGIADIARMLRLPPVLGVFPLSVALGYSALVPQLGSVMEHYRGDRIGGMRAVFDVVGAKVSAEEKLLIAPSIQYNHQPQFKSEIYFGQNALYLSECREDTLREFIAKNSIRYIFLSQDLDWRILNDSVYYTAGIGTCTGLSPKNYDLNQELQRIRELLSEYGAKQLPVKAVYGELYELSPTGPQPSPASPQ